MLMLPIVAVLFGAGITLSGVGLARLHARHTAPDRGAYIVASAISNYGFTLGGFVCLLFCRDGQKALSMQTIFIFPLVAYIYLLWFPIGRYYGTMQKNVTPLQSFLTAFRDITTLPLAGTLAGLAINFSGAAQPEFFAPVKWVLVYVGTAASTFCIGVTLRPRSIGTYKRENASVSITKFLVAPLLGYGLARLFGIDGTAQQVIVILCSVPVGLFSSFAASLFGLNRDLTNSLFLVNTVLFLLVILPLLVLLLPYLA